VILLILLTLILELVRLLNVGRLKDYYFINLYKHPDSDKLWCEKINIGSEVREIASGLQ